MSIWKIKKHNAFCDDYWQVYRDRPDIDEKEFANIPTGLFGSEKAAQEFADKLNREGVER